MSSILIVDDDADIRLLLRLELSAEGHRISEAVNGKVALEAMEAERPDLAQPIGKHHLVDAVGEQ